jgi:1-phosphatidylinositol-3-phosphate 5-kinase
MLTCSLLYTDLLAPKTLCEHAQTPSKMITTIRSPHTVLNLTVRPITVLETRLPKLQVGPNVAKRKAARAGTQGTVDGLMKKEARVAAVDAVKLEVETVLQRLKERCAEVVSDI